jgi:uncharacterized circularly permuted ATP-grasp superfamily protein/uncharacterized alpha-E superfamily protein
VPSDLAEPKASPAASLPEVSPEPSRLAAEEVGPRDFSEVSLAGLDATATYARLKKELLTPGPGHLGRMAVHSRRLMRDLGVTFNLYRDEPARENILPFDPFPRVIDAGTWDLLCRGLEQRVRIWNDFFRDIYDSQEVLKNGIVPFELVYDDPHYQRNAVGLKVPDDTYVHVAAFDLARDVEGRWIVLEDYVGNTTGVTYALSARNVLSQAAPDLLETADLEPVHSYPTELLEHLRGFAHGSIEPRVVLLSPGIFNSAYYEHSSLARQMGIPLVRGSDLIVLNSRCFLKTIGGLEPIDVIYRRLDESFIDPVAFRGDSQLGVPGLMTCVRKGTVTIANAVGSGLGDNRAIASCLSRLARFYRHEPLLLPTVDRRLCFDPDQRELVLGDLPNYVVQHISERSTGTVWDTARMPEAEIAALRSRLEKQPSQFVAEPRLPRTVLPTIVDDDRLAPRHAGLRCFVFGGRNPRVFPIGLTRYAPEAGSRTISSGLGGGIKDTWILRGAGKPETAAAPIIVASPQRRLRLGSRIADSLFWMGRYKARAENTTRILRVLQQVQLESPSLQRAQAWAPLWEALARATGHDTNFFKSTPLLRQHSVSHYILLDRTNPASVLNCVGWLRENARTTRESVPPEVWAVINRLWQVLEVNSVATPLNDDQGLPQVQELEQRILDEIDALSGCAAKNMLRDDAWHFWTLGRHVERALTATLVTRQVLLKRADEAAAAGAADTNLDALLRMLSCQYAYRSLFQARPTAQNVVALVLQDPALPRSVLHCLEAIRESLERVSGGETRRRDGASPLRTCAQLSGEVEFADLNSLFSPTGNRAEAAKPLFLDAWLEDLASRLLRLALEISDHHLYHQAFNILR